MAQDKVKSYGRVSISTDKGYLRLQFSSALSQAFYGKRQFFKSLGRTDSEQNRKWAEAIAARIQADIDHPDSLFDTTLQKYLAIDVGILKLERSLTLENLWLEFVEYKYRIGKISETTYRTRYKRTFTNWLSPYLKETLSYALAEKIVIDLLDQQVNRVNLKKLISALQEACDRAIKQGKLGGQNFFTGLGDDIKSAKRSHQLQEAEDYRAFTQEERNTIVQAFYLSDKKSDRQIADLIAFLFLTGCRLGEAFALKSDDLQNDFIIFDESYSSETKILKSTKTDTTRIFKIKGYPKLQNLIKSLKNKALPDQKYVFTTLTGKQYDRFKLSALWLGQGKSNRYYDGLVTRLAKEKKISQYLKPSATRHTFITLQAQAGVDLKLLADSVGNSVDTIYNHYLDINKNAHFMDI